MVHPRRRRARVATVAASGRPRKTPGRSSRSRRRHARAREDRRGGVLSPRRIVLPPAGRRRRPSPRAEAAGLSCASTTGPLLRRRRGRPRFRESGEPARSPPPALGVRAAEGCRGPAGGAPPPPASTPPSKFSSALCPRSASSVAPARISSLRTTASATAPTPHQLTATHGIRPKRRPPRSRAPAIRGGDRRSTPAAAPARAPQVPGRSERAGLGGEPAGPGARAPDAGLRRGLPVAASPRSALPAGQATIPPARKTEAPGFPRLRTRRTRRAPARPPRPRRPRFRAEEAAGAEKAASSRAG
jgi:hypothetical protein